MANPTMQMASDPASTGLQPGDDGCMWLDRHYRGPLTRAGLAAFDDVMATSQGRCLRVLDDRENWHLRLDVSDEENGGPSPFAGTAQRVLCTNGDCPPFSLGMYLKKHRIATWSTRVRARLGMNPAPSAGRIEAQNVGVLAQLGIEAMRLVAYGERLCPDGRFESFLLTEELEGYCELQAMLRQRFLPSSQRSAEQNRELRRIIRQVAAIARRFHAAGYNHRDFNGYHFLIKEHSPGQFDIRLIDLQRMQHRRWFRWRWIVKDLAQLAATVPGQQIGCRDRVAFLRHYLGVRRLRPEDKRLIRAVARKQLLIQRRERRKAS